MPLWVRLREEKKRVVEEEEERELLLELELDGEAQLEEREMDQVRDRHGDGDRDREEDDEVPDVDAYERQENGIMHTRRRREREGISRNHAATTAGSNNSLISAVKSFTLSSWNGDADILNNVLRLLPLIHTLRLNIGTNFSPEHLDEVFLSPKPRIKLIDLRFRPYVEKASYYQFLKGSYFDSAIESLINNWGEVKSLTHVALVQDIPPRFSVPHLVKRLERLARSGADSGVTSGTVTTVASSRTGSDIEDEEGAGDGNGNGGGEGEAIVTELADDPDDDVTYANSLERLADATPVEPRGYTGHGPFPFLSEELARDLRPKTFAQPIVFFDIRCLARLATAKASRHVTHFRLRIPCRDIAKVLCEPVNDGTNGRSFFPSLRYLDISTTNIRIDGWFPTLVKRYDKLQHLVLDRTNLFGFQGKDNGAELCETLGKECVMVGLARAKEREREIGAWDQEERKRFAIREREKRRAAEAARNEAARLRARQAEQERAERRANGETDLSDDDEDGPEQEGAEEQAQASSSTPAAFPEHNRVSPALARARARRAARSIAFATFSIRDNTARNRANQSGSTNADDLIDIPDSNLSVFILPPLPTLNTVSIGGEATKLTREKSRQWEKHFHTGWKDGLDKLIDWANRSVEKYERASRLARQWRQQEEGSFATAKASSGSGNGGAGASIKGNTKAGGGKPLSTLKTKPPLDVRLYRYPQTPEEIASAIATTIDDPKNPFSGLIQVNRDTDHNSSDIYSDWKSPYLEAKAEAEASALAAEHGNDLHQPSVILCCVPDCEGPMRRGDEGDRLDGRSGMKLVNGAVSATLKHRPGCGHLVGRQEWDQ